MTDRPNHKSDDDKPKGKPDDGHHDEHRGETDDKRGRGHQPKDDKDKDDKPRDDKEKNDRDNKPRGDDHDKSKPKHDDKPKENKPRDDRDDKPKHDQPPKNDKPHEKPPNEKPPHEKPPEQSKPPTPPGQPQQPNQPSQPSAPQNPTTPSQPSPPTPPSGGGSTNPPPASSGGGGLTTSTPAVITPADKIEVVTYAPLKKVDTPHGSAKVAEPFANQPPRQYTTAAPPARSLPRTGGVSNATLVALAALGVAAMGGGAVLSRRRFLSAALATVVRRVP